MNTSKEEKPFAFSPLSEGIEHPPAHFSIVRVGFIQSAIIGSSPVIEPDRETVVLFDPSTLRADHVSVNNVETDFDCSEQDLDILVHLIERIMVDTCENPIQLIIPRSLIIYA